MRTVQEISDSAREVRPFSNSGAGYGWMNAHCGTCVHEKPTRQGREWDGCPLIALSMGGWTPAEWIPGDPNEGGRWDAGKQFTCIEYRHEDEGGDPEPRPVPTPPGQLELFPRDGLEGTRMLKPLTSAGGPACDHVFATTAAGEPTACACGYTYVEYDRTMGERMAQAMESPDAARSVPEAVTS